MGPLSYDQPPFQDLLQGTTPNQFPPLSSNTAHNSQLNSISLSKNCLRALEAARADMPPMEAFPRSHIVTFKYYVGVIHFLDEEYHRVHPSSFPFCSPFQPTILTGAAQAEEHLTSAWQTCHKSAHRNKEYVPSIPPLLSPSPIPIFPNPSN